MPARHLHFINLQESTKDIITAGFAYGSVGLASLSEINSVLSFISLGAALILSGLRIYSWFERRRSRIDKKE